MRTKWRLEIILFALVLLTLLAVIAEKKILQAAMIITPQSGHLIELYDDSRAGGNSHAEIINLQNFQWRCTLKAKYAYPHCGFEIMFDPKREHGLDLSHFTKFVSGLTIKAPTKPCAFTCATLTPATVQWKLSQVQNTTKLNFQPIC